eukprot:1157936-Pelagomonas_calceolata.AAC.6
MEGRCQKRCQKFPRKQSKIAKSASFPKGRAFLKAGTSKCVHPYFIYVQPVQIKACFNLAPNMYLLCPRQCANKLCSKEVIIKEGQQFLNFVLDNYKACSSVQHELTS